MSEPGFQKVEAVQREMEGGGDYFLKGKWKHSGQEEQWGSSQEKETQIREVKWEKIIFLRELHFGR